MPSSLHRACSAASSRETETAAAATGTGVGVGEGADGGGDGELEPSISMLLTEEAKAAALPFPEAMEEGAAGLTVVTLLLVPLSSEVQKVQANQTKSAFKTSQVCSKRQK